MQTIKPASEDHWKALRTEDITSTDISALFGISPYSTEFELWHRKKNKDVVDVNNSERVRWGSRLQDAIAFGIAEDNKFKIRRMDEYCRIPDLNIGSSFDYMIGNDSLLEIKNIDSLQLKEKWIIDGDNIEAPPHIELQVQHQMLVAELNTAFIGALIGGNRVILIRREADAKIHEAIKEKVKKFWESIKENKPPNPDFQKDAMFISRLYRYSEPGKVYQSNDNEQLRKLVEIYKDATEKSKQIDAVKNATKAEILTIINDAEKVIGEGYTINAGLIGPTEIPAHTRQGYRNFKVYIKKEKTNDTGKTGT